MSQNRNLSVAFRSNAFTSAAAARTTIEKRIRLFEQKNGIRLDDEVRFIRSWLERPLSTGAVTPSGRVLARTMARYVDPAISGPVVELGPGTGPVTEALVDQGIAPERLVLVEFNPDLLPAVARALSRPPPSFRATPTACARLLGGLLQQPAAAVVSGLPLFSKPMRMRLRLFREALELLAPNAPFIQFTYAVVPPIPKRLAGVRAEASERIWKNMPPARVWVYRKG